MSKLKFFLPAIIFIGLIGLFLNGLTRDPTIVPSPFIGKPAPAFDLPRLLEPDMRLTNADLKGQLSLLNVWASWCPGCAQEHEMLLSIAQNSGIPIYGLNWKDENSAALSWLQLRGNPYRAIAVDRDNVTGIDWGVYGAPETFLIDQEGIILYKLIGPMTLQVWENEFIPLIEKSLGIMRDEQQG